MSGLLPVYFSGLIIIEMSFNPSQPPTIQKPQVSKPSKGGGLLFQNAATKEVIIAPQQKPVSPSPPQQKYSTVTFTQPSLTTDKPKIEKKKDSPMNPIILRKQNYTPVELKKLNNSNTPGYEMKRKSKGFIILMNFYQEIKNPEQFRSSGKYSKKRFNKSSGDAKLIELNPDRFTTTKLEKNAGLWDETSDEAFTMRVNQILNGLTAQKLDEALRGLEESLSVTGNPELVDMSKPRMNQEEKIKYIADIIVKKASSELAFADIYSKLSAKCSNELRTSIVTRTNTDFYEFLYNPGDPDSEEDSLNACGTAKFFGALISQKVVDHGSSLTAFETLISKLHSQDMHPQFVEMTKDFVLAAGKDFSLFINKDHPELFKLLDQCKNNPGLKARLRFLLKDVIEQRDEWIYGKRAPRAQVVQVDDKPSDLREAQAQIRSAFSSFVEGDTPHLTIQSRDFLRAAIDLLIDQKEIYSYCSFVASMLLTMKTNPLKDIQNVMCQKLKEFVTQNIEKDCPKIWNNISDLIYTLILNHLITKDNARHIKQEFPDHGKNWNPENGLKWYITDYLDFYEPISLDKYWPPELHDVLQMPKTIKQPKDNMKMSRLIVVAMIRSISAILSTDRIELSDFDKWKPLLKEAFSKYENIFSEEMDALLSYRQSSISLDNVINYITA